MLVGSSFIREAHAPIYALAYEFGVSGYDWARRVQIHVLLDSRAEELIEIVTEGFNLETGDLAWANVALACRDGKFIFADDDEPGRAGIEDEIAREIHRRGIEPDIALSPALSDGFHSGLLVCVAEKEIVLAIDRAARKELVRRAQRWQRMTLRHWRWRWRMRREGQQG